MKTTVSSICRGQGVAYIELLSRGKSSNSSLQFDAVSEEEIPLPVATYSTRTDQTSETTVIVTPLLETKKVIIRIGEFNACGAQISRAEVSLNRFAIKWSSRLNYKINRHHASLLRDMDRYTYSNQIHINPIICHWAEHGDQIIVKGVICSPQDEPNAKLQLLRSNGCVVSDFSPYYGKTSQSSHEGIPRLETPFTARLVEGETYCLVARGSSSCRPAFMCFDPASREFYRSTYEPRYYPLAAPGVWDGHYKNHLRQFNLANPKDFDVQGGPTFSVVVPLYHTPALLLKEMIDSVVGQLYQNWELILVNSTPEDGDLALAISKYSDRRIKTINLMENKGISENTNAGINVASGDYVAFLDHDDLIDSLALYKFAKEIVSDPEIDVLYSDEDNLAEDGTYCNPNFKSAFNPDLLRCHNYITHFVAVRASLAKQLTLRAAFDGAQDYDFLLRASEKTERFRHVPEVLYHWRMSDTSTAKSADNKSYAEETGMKALREHLGRCNLEAIVEQTSVPFHYNVKYVVQGNPLVSIIIPNKDNAEVLNRCIESLISITDYKNYEIIIVENNSSLQETFDYYRSIEEKYSFVSIRYWKDTFNYSRINNYGETFARGEYLLLLNNDIEIIDGDWLGSMLGYCQRKDVGVVGAKLLYPDGTVQHAGVTMQQCPLLVEMGGPVHMFNHYDANDSGYMWHAIFSQDVTAVTGACLLTKRSIFKEVCGLSERFTVAYNDIDYCLKVLEAGYRVVFDANAQLYHYESLSRGSDKDPSKVNRFMSEQGMLRTAWPKYYSQGDPYYSKYAL